MPARVNDIVAAARNVVRRARTEGRLEQITIKLVRRQVEEELGLEAGTADAFKSEIKKAVDDALDEGDKENVVTTTSRTFHNAPRSHENINLTEPAEGKKRKSEPTGHEPVKRAKGNDGNSVSQSPQAPRKRGPAQGESLKTNSLPLTPGVTANQKDEGKSETRGGRDALSSQAARHSIEADVPPVSAADNGSDTELSSVYDEPRPATKMRGRSKNTGNAGKKADPGPKDKDKKTDKVDDKDEETIKKLKSLVVACGVRKIWTKELAQCRTTSDQIRHLKRLLADLGMTGRLSVEKAKSIRAKRELAKELEDVLEWEKTKGASVTEPRSTAKEAKARLNGSAVESENEEVGEIKVKKNRNADIFAFIGDQSSDED